MSEALSDRIYQAQCMGNIEPIEFMVPYPNIYSLIEGENIKYGHQVLFTDYNLTNKDFLRLVHQGANWLRENGVQPKERVFIHDLEYPMAEIFAFSIWAYGATVVLFHIDDEVYDDGRINLDKLNPVGRLAGHTYSRTKNTFEIIRKIKPD